MNPYTDKLALVVLATTIYITTITSSYATNSAMGYVTCQLVFMMYGNLGRGLAVLAITTLGIGAFLGKLHWGTALVVGAGISVIFGAPLIAGTIINNTYTTFMGYGGDCWND